jgi:phosphopantothenoylcysteine decarboxylase/phosphopantothenate--cysteine ligase
VKAHIDGVDLFFGVAAVADYTPERPSNHKLKKTGEAMELRLKPTEDILAWLAKRADAPFCVGFAAESENLADYAQAKRAKKGIPMIVANLVQDAVGKDENAVTIYDDDGVHPVARAPKATVAQAVLAHALRLLEARRPSATITSIKQAS